MSKDNSNTVPPSPDKAQPLVTVVPEDETALPPSAIEARKSLEITKIHEIVTNSSDNDDSEKGSGLRASKSPAHPLISFWRRDQERARYGEMATQPSVFDDPATLSFYAPPSTYENAHRFDPSLRWTWGEELRAVTKLDWRITLWSVFVFMIHDMNRSNLIQANTDNFLPDLNMDTDDYNMGLTVLRVTGICAEIPMQFISRKVGIDRFLPIQMTLWGLVSMSQFWLTGRTTFLVTRCLLALFSSAVTANILVYFSYFFTSIELPFRLTIFASGNRINDIISPLLALGILRMRGTAGKEGWRWLFLIEGGFTLCIALWSAYIMVPSLTQTKARFRRRGWFSEREEKILVNRLLRDDPAKSNMHNRQIVNPRLFWQALREYDVWPLYIMSLIVRIPSFTPDLYFTLILRALGFSTSDTNLLSVPPYVAHLFTAFAITLLAEKTNQRCLAAMVCQLWNLPIFISLIIVPFAIGKRWSIYALYFTTLAGPPLTGFMGGWISRNSNSVATRSIGATIFSITIQASFIFSSNVYREADRPAYRYGNKVLLSITMINILLITAIKSYYVLRNKQRQRQWDAMSEDEKARYLDEHQHVTGPGRLDFKLIS